MLSRVRLVWNIQTNFSHCQSHYSVQIQWSDSVELRVVNSQPKGIGFDHSLTLCTYMSKLHPNPKYLLNKIILDNRSEMCLCFKHERRSIYRGWSVTWDATSTSVEGQAVGQQLQEAPLLFCSRTIYTIIQSCNLFCCSTFKKTLEETTCHDRFSLCLPTAPPPPALALAQCSSAAGLASVPAVF